MSPIPGQFHPIRPTHAIERVALQISFGGELTDLRLGLEGSWRSLKDSLAPNLPAFNLETIGQFVRSDAQVPAPAYSANFAFIAPDGQAEKVLRVDPHAITYLTTKYTHWEDLCSEGLNAIELAATECFYNQGFSVREVGLQYENRFLWDGDYLDFDPQKILRPNSAWLTPRIYNTTKNWHCNCGEFESVSSGIRRLVRVNTAAVVADDLMPDNRSIVLAVSLSDALNQRGYDPTEPMDGSASEAWIRERLEALHASEKRIVAEIIDDDMQERITLRANVDA